MRSEQLSGPHALEARVAKHYANFQAASRLLPTHMASEKVIWAMPRSESLEDPPLSFGVVTLRAAKDRLRQVGIRDPLSEPPPPGMLYAVASCTNGRFKGTWLGLLSIPQPEEQLPATVMVSMESPENN
jgi:hypothetical protein